MVPLLGIALLAHMQVLPVGRAGVLRPAPGVARASLPSAVEDENEDRLVRLDKLLAERGAGSRKDVDRMIRKGLVELDGEIVGKAGAKLKVPWSSTPWADGFDYPPPPLLVGYHKPLGVVSSMRDDRSRPDLSSVLPLPWQKLMHPVGRLDADTTGLLLFSRDGERARLEVASPDGLLALACPCQRRTSASACRPTGDLTHRLLHPKYLVEREYVAEVENEIDAARLGASLAAGVETTEEGESLVVRAELVAVEGSTVRLVVTEGKYRMVRRVLANCGHPVVALHRVRYGEVELDALEIEEGEAVAIEGRSLEWVLSLRAEDRDDAARARPEGGAGAPATPRAGGGAVAASGPTRAPQRDLAAEMAEAARREWVPPPNLANLVEIVAEQACVDEAEALESLRRNNGDVVRALRELER